MSSYTSIAAQKIIFSDPKAPVEVSPSVLETRKELLQDKSQDGAPVSHSSSGYNVGTASAGIPDIYTGPLKKKKNWLTADSGDDQNTTDGQKSTLEKGSRLEKGWSDTKDPFSQGSDKTRSQNSSFDSRDDSLATRGPWADHKDLNDSKIRGLSDISTGQNPFKSIQDMQNAQIAAFSKLYDMPSATAPVSSPYDAANSPLDSPWGAQQPENRNTPSYLTDDPPATPAPESYNRGSSIPSRGLAENPQSRDYYQGYREQTINPNQPSPNAQQPGMLNIPRRPGSLLR